MHAFTGALLSLLVKSAYSLYKDVVCHKNWYLDTPRPAPRKCPPPDFVSYYECCGESDNCCRRVRIELLIFLFVPLSLLVIVLCCCTIFSMYRRRSQQEEKQPRLSRDEKECHYFY
ncbi:unnamed protein product [Cylicocyclus nassatus]|uniref:Vesicular, overexpressed in cancer, prosurvival protein 1 n=1 Tax=Cylicocyclus nassatus TaxID=53992 RepID=A0AA36M653_CYLNA|nr:unnamed protein product [Cylicocyclus nassatus]